MKSSEYKTITCEHCRLDVRLPSWRFRQPVRFCSRDCHRAWQRLHVSPHNQTCAECGGGFLDHASAKRKFCSLACKRKASHKQERRTCPACLTPFVCHPSRQKKYCSRQCAADAQRGKSFNPRPVRMCEFCHKPFEYISYKGGEGRFCSRKCALSKNNEESRKPIVTKNCAYCGNTFSYRFYDKLDRSYCSIKCAVRDKVKTGTDNQGWKPRVPLECEICGSVVEVRPYRVKRFRACSARCRQVLVMQAMPRVSSIERKMAEAFRLAGLSPIPQHTVEFWVVDFAFPDQRLVVECDGTYWHGRPEQRRKDRHKDAYLKRKGWRVLRLSEAAINHSPSACASTVQGWLNSSAEVFQW